MPKIMLETTEWADGQGANHVYVFTDKPTGRSARAIAYVPDGPLPMCPQDPRSSKSSRNPWI